MSQQLKDRYGYDQVATLIVEYNVAVPFEYIIGMSADDPLFEAMAKALKRKEDRLDRRTARICATIAQCAGNKVSEDDFIPKAPLTPEQREKQILANIALYNAQFA